MGKLAHLMEGDRSVSDLTKHLTQSRDSVDLWLQTLKEVTELMRSVSQRLDLVEESLADLAIPDSGPAVEEMRAEMHEHRQSSVAELNKAVQSIASRISAIRIPAAKEPPKIDLDPILAALNALKHQAPPAQPEHPHEWYFEIERDRFSLIKSVTAKAL